MSLNTSDPKVLSAIHELENDTDIQPMQKALILLVADGVKPATWQVIFSEKWEDGAKETPVTDKRWYELHHIFEGLGLTWKSMTRIDDQVIPQPRNEPHRWVELADILLARDVKTANKLADAVAKWDHREIGLTLGIAPTAVEAFMTGNLIPYDERPTSTPTMDKNTMKFLNHMLSKNNWENEILHLPIYASRVKALSEKIYNECIKDK